MSISKGDTNARSCDDEPPAAPDPVSEERGPKASREPKDKSPRAGAGKGQVRRLKPAPSTPAALEGDDWLGTKLRETYDDVVKEELPEEFEVLLAKLDDASREAE